jgi:hypothetical protein
MRYVRAGVTNTCANREQQLNNKTKRLKGLRFYVVNCMRLLEHVIKIVYFPSFRNPNKRRHTQKKFF